MKHERFMALEFSTKMKTSVLEGIITEKEFISSIINEYDLVIEDAMIITLTGKKPWKKEMYINVDDISDQQFALLDKTIGKDISLNALRMNEKGQLEIKNIFHDWEDINIKHQIQQVETPNVSLGQIDMKKNTNIIGNFDSHGITSFINRMVFSTLTQTYFRPSGDHYVTNIDVIAFLNGKVSFIELKMKSREEYIPWMNPGEYNLYRLLQNNGSVIRYFVRGKGDIEWTEYNARFIFPPEQKIFGAGTSYYGNKEQKVYKIEDCWPIQKSED